MPFLQLSKFSVVRLYFSIFVRYVVIIDNIEVNLSAFIERKPKDHRMYVIGFCTRMILQYTFPKSFLKLLFYFQTIIATGVKKLKTSFILGNPKQTFSSFYTKILSIYQILQV
jgi:hypothetical protein